MVENLKTQQENLLRAIGDVRQGLEEALMTPAVIFATRQAELEALQGEFAGAGAGKQVAMVPELLRRIQELFQLGANADVLGQDREGLRRLQQDLLGFVEEIEQTAGKDAFDQQIATAQEQVDLLGDIKRISDTHLTAMNSTLQAHRAAFWNGANPVRGDHSRREAVPRTGLARVHQGEYVLPAQMAMTMRQAPAGATTTLHLTQHVTLPPGTSREMARQIGQAAWGFIENEARLRRIPLKLDDR